MITNFNIFLNEKRLTSGQALYLSKEILMPEGMTYEQAIELSNIAYNIRNYVIIHYKIEVHFTGHKDLPSVSVNTNSGVEKLLRFAKKYEDQHLTDMIHNYLDRIEEIKLSIISNKYNL